MLPVATRLRRRSRCSTGRHRLLLTHRQLNEHRLALTNGVRFLGTLAQHSGCEGPVGEQRHRERRQPEPPTALRSEEHTSELQSRGHLVCRLLLEKKNHTIKDAYVQ